MLKTCQKSLVLQMKNVSVCTLKTSPCMPAQRAHMFQHECAWWRYTRGRFERTHGDVLSGHTGFFQCATPHTTHHHTTQHTTTHGDRDRQRQTETEEEDRERRQGQREKGRRKRREDKRREDKRRQDKTREERRFIFSVVVHGRS